MTSLVSNIIIKTLCDNQGSLDFQSLEEKLAQSVTAAEPVLRKVLFDDGKIALREAGPSVSAPGQIIGRKSLVVAKTSLRICQKKPGECPQCDSLHLCRYLVCGECMFGHKCKNPHSLASPYNAKLLRRYGLHELTEKQLFQLLLQNDPFLLPEVCPHFNKGNGAYGSCKFTTSCTKLHVCLHHFQGDCKFGMSCKRPHSVEAQHIKILRGLSQENITNLLKTYRNKFIITGQPARPPSAVPVLPKVQNPIQETASCRQPGPPTSSSSLSPPISSTGATKPKSDADRNEICLFFIRKHCSFKEKCARVHWNLPYRWQVLSSDRVTWQDLANMEDIEKAYCDPRQETSCTDQLSPILGIFQFFTVQSAAPPAVETVDFIKMTCGGSPVRRLSTASSVSKPPHFILTTTWLWYWKDETGKWQEYGQGDNNASSSVTSQTLEEAYLADRDTDLPFSSGTHKYILVFRGAPGTQQMYQQNVKYKTKREVTRRPRFVSAQDVEAQLKSASSQSSSTCTAEFIPFNWDKTALPNFGYKLVLLSKSERDYKMIELLFRRTMAQSRINSIQRIQNPSLWKVFHWQREQMKATSGGKAVEEKYLFHGTDESLLEAICEQNFDWRMCGVHGTAYGKGSYFARDASYSDRYAAVRRSRNKIMFVALVLVGDYTRGSSSYVRPPPKAGSNGHALYDSCVDNQSDPSIFVVFEKQQIYPEYVIDYS